MVSDWDDFLIEGDELFDYMTQNFESMFDAESKIKHFIIIDKRYRFWDIIDEINEKYQYDIQKELVPWIKSEFETNQLFEKTNWKPFRDLYQMSVMVLGYKKMFRYKQYYFQLSLDNEYNEYNEYKETDQCVYCKNEEYFPYFVLALYGWKEDGHEKLQPDDDAIIPSDNIMPMWYWKIK